MRHWVLLLLLAVTVAVIAYLVVWMFTGNDDGLDPEEPDGRAVPLPGSRPLVESDISALRFDTVARGYRMVQVDAALRRAAYDVGYKQELIDVLEAEVIALREGRTDDAEALRQARDGALGGSGTTIVTTSPSNASRDEADAAAAEPANDSESDFDADRVAQTDREAQSDREAGIDRDAGRGSRTDGAVEYGGDVADGATAESGEDPIAGPDLGRHNGAANRTYHEETLGDRAATGR
jgi:DivIVA domain-containing protein